MKVSLTGSSKSLYKKRKYRKTKYFSEKQFYYFIGSVSDFRNNSYQSKLRKKRNLEQLFSVRHHLGLEI